MELDKNTIKVIKVIIGGVECEVPVKTFVRVDLVAAAVNFSSKGSQIGWNERGNMMAVVDIKIILRGIALLDVAVLIVCGEMIMITIDQAGVIIDQVDPTALMMDEEMIMITQDQEGITIDQADQTASMMLEEMITITQDQKGIIIDQALTALIMGEEMIQAGIIINQDEMMPTITMGE
mmetsp:Transcript_33541/g.71495  ORF Transcript_33541/g.71495 Transcript_33541/m.71495 type:complete len:179 (+) Transcript_33541:556-1092(+)